MTGLGSTPPPPPRSDRTRGYAQAGLLTGPPHPRGKDQGPESSWHSPLLTDTCKNVMRTRLAINTTMVMLKQQSEFGNGREKGKD